MWEIGIKSGLGKLSFGVDLDTVLVEMSALKSISIVPVEVRHVLRVAVLPHHHRDPFDRVIIAQALVDGLRVLSSDSVLDAYGIDRIF